MRATKCLKFYFLSLLCMALVAGVAQATEGDVYTLLEDSSLRQGPDNFYASTSSALKGAQAIELKSSGDWKKVRLFSSGDVGWVYSATLAAVSVNVEASQVLESSAVEAIAEPQVIQNDQQLLPGDKPDLLAHPEPEQSGATQSAVKAQADEMEILLLKPEETVQNMAPSKDNLDGELVRPMFEDGAVSQESIAGAAIEAKSDVEKAETVPAAVALSPVESTPAAVALSPVESTPAPVALSPVESIPAAVALSPVESIPAAVALSPIESTPAAETIPAAPVSAKPALQQFPVQLISSDAVDEPAVNKQVDETGGGATASVHAPAPSLLPVSSPVASTKKLEVYAVQKNDISTGINSDVNTNSMAVLSNNDNAEPAVNEQRAKPLGTSQMVMQTAVIRVGPSALSEVLGWAGAGAQVQTMHRQGKWMKVRLLDSDRIGWVEAVALDGTNVPVTSMVMATLPEQSIQKTAVEPRVADLNAVSVVQSNEATDVVPPEVMVESQPVAKESEQASKATLQRATHDLGRPLALETVPPTSVEKAVEEAVNPANSVYRFNKRSTLRAGPNARFDSVYWAGKGAQASELDRKGSWVRIQMQVSKKIGWVYEQSLQLVAAGAAVGVGATATAVTEMISPEPVLNVNLHSKQEGNVEDIQAIASKDEPTAMTLYSFNEKSNLRAGPALKYDAVSWAGKGAYAVEQDRKGDWIRVQMQVNKRIGWVNSRSLSLVKSGVIAPAAMVVNSDKVAAGVEESIDDSDHKMHFFKRTSNLRAGPGKEFERVAWGGRNESAEQIEHKGDWKRVRMTISGKTGWVFNEYLVRAVHSGHIMGVKRSVLTPAVKSAEKSGQMYLVVRTVPLRSGAGDSAELIGSVQKGDLVAWLEERNGWVRVNPQVNGGKIGWVEANLLRKQEQFKVERTQALINNENALSYKDRISTGETFNFSYAALEEALYKVPVEEIHIRIREDDLKAVFLKRQYDQSPFEIRLTTGRHRLSGTLKVLGSSTRIFKKKSIMIKLDKESARWYGHRRIALRSMASDKALMREWMAWKMMAALGMKVPEVHFTRVSFNRGEKTALYLSIEWMGAEFLEGNNLDARGEFYQPNDAAHCGDLYSTNQMDLCFDKITPQDKDYSNLISMAESVNEATNDNIDKVLAKYFEDESIINWMAVNALVTNGDTYNKNYWLYYHSTKEKWTVVPWDYNLTFGRTYDQYATTAFRIFNDNFQYYYPPDVGAGNPIKDKALRNPALRKRLEDKIKHLTGMEPNGSEHTFGWFSPTVMQARIGNLAAVVGKEVYKDTFLSYGEADFTKTYESLMHYVTAHDYFLKTKLFGDFPWAPEPPNQPYIFMPLPDTLTGEGQIDAGAESLHMVDRGWGYFVARLNLNEPLKTKAGFEVKVEGGITPKYLPTVVQSANRCIERSWLLKTTSKNVSVTGDLMIEYTQENSRRSEVPPSIHEELLELWMLDGNRWKPIQTVVNEYSNTLVAKNVHVQSGHQYRFVACSPF